MLSFYLNVFLLIDIIISFVSINLGFLKEVNMKIFFWIYPVF